MHDGTLRRVLMTETRDLHETLDREIGAFGDVEAYGAFLSGSYVFRSAIEPQLAAMPGWQVEPLAGLIAQDLADLGLPLPGAAPAPSLPDAAGQAGACYVLEGSALGGRLLARRAAGLGFGAGHGARHLAVQTASGTRWKQFLIWLEAARIPAPRAVAAARGVFALALGAYGVKAAT